MSRTIFQLPLRDATYSWALLPKISTVLFGLHGTLEAPDGLSGRSILPAAVRIGNAIEDSELRPIATFDQSPNAALYMMEHACYQQVQYLDFEISPNPHRTTEKHRADVIRLICMRLMRGYTGAIRFHDGRELSESQCVLRIAQPWHDLEGAQPASNLIVDEREPGILADVYEMIRQLGLQPE